MKKTNLSSSLYPKLHIFARGEKEKQYLSPPLTKSAVLRALQRVKQGEKIAVAVVYGYMIKNGKRVRVANEGEYQTKKDALQAIEAFLEEVV